MTKIYQSCSKGNFLNTVSDYVIDHLNTDLSKLKVILPSGLACNELQKILVTKLGSAILPKITTFGTLSLEGDEVFNIPSRHIATVSILEERIILAEIINSYDKLDYSLSQSLSLASCLANLFFEFESNHIDLLQLKNLPDLDQAEYWNVIYDFLNYAFEHWKKKIHSLNKVTRGAYQKSIFSSEIKRLKNNQDELLLIAGVIGNNLISDNFIRDVMQLENSYMILPPTMYLYDKEEYEQGDALYKIHELLKLLGCSLQDIKMLDSDKHKANMLDALIVKREFHIKRSDINYVECVNIFHEAEYIATRCINALRDNPDSKIAIIAYTQAAKEQYSVSLDKYGVIYQDLFGLDILKHNVISFLLLISKNLCCAFDSKIFFSLLSHPLIISEQTQDIQNIIRKNTRILISPDDVLELLRKYGSVDLYEYYSDIHNIIFAKLSSSSFDSVFREIVKGAESLVPDVWQEHPDIASSLRDIIQINWDINLDNIEGFPDLLKHAITGGRLASGSYSDVNITLCKSFDTTLINYDLMIVADLNEGVYPSDTYSNPWLSSTMKNKLNLASNQINFGIQLYEFYLNLQNKEVLLIRSRKQTSSKEMLPSPFIMQLKHILGDDIKHQILVLNSGSNASLVTEKERCAKSDIFPKVISATDIETLMRTPYNFYAKKILKLYKLDEIDDQPNLAEFGNFFHLVAENYTKNNLHSSEGFIDIGKSVLSHLLSA